MVSPFASVAPHATYPFPRQTQKVLWVAQGSKSLKPRRSTPKHGDWENLADEFEQRQDYRERLAKVLTRSAEFQASLAESQLERWLALEEALLELSWWLHGAYFRAGFDLGQKTRRRASRGTRAAPQQAQAEFVLALTRLVRELGPR